MTNMSTGQNESSPKRSPRRPKAPVRVTPEAQSDAWHRAAAKVLTSTENMVDAVIEKAKQGNPQAAKFAFDFAGVKPDGAAGGEAGDELMTRLLEHLEEDATSDPEPESV